MVKSVAGYMLDARSLEMLRGWLEQTHEEIYEDWYYLHSVDFELDTWLDCEYPDVFAEWVLEAK